MCPSGETAVVTLCRTHFGPCPWMHREQPLFIYLRLSLYPCSFSHSHTDTHTRAQTNKHFSSLDPWGFPRVMLFARFTTKLSFRILCYSPLGLRAEDCAGWHFSCVQLLLDCTDMLLNLCEHTLQTVVCKKFKANSGVLGNINIWFYCVVGKYWS